MADKVKVVEIDQVREKLLDIMHEGWVKSNKLCSEQVECELCPYNAPQGCRFGLIADHLIANGVTVGDNLASTVTDNNVVGKTECEYCQQFDDPCGVPMIAEEDSEPDRGIYLYNGFLCANGGEFCEAKVNFCPMCGRKLAEPPKGE